MIEGIQAEYPVDHDAVLRAALLRNRYLHPDRPTWLEIVRSMDASESVAEANAGFSDIDVQFVDVPIGDGYVYSPRAGIADLTANDLRNIRLAIAVRRYDLFIISRTLNTYPDVGAALLQDLVVYRRRWNPGQAEPASARVMRLMPGSRRPVALSTLMGDAVLSIDHAFGVSDGDISSPSVLPLSVGSLGSKTSKPVVFVFPVFLAMGGAERLVVETTRHLSAKYHFVIINTEPLRPEHGSMHTEALLYADVYDIAETVREEDRLTAIELLNRYYQPVVVWITNGSPWQIKNANRLRHIFSKTPIVDNQCYDHEQGWINAFADPEVRSADRYIAINSKIKSVMIERHGVPEDSIRIVSFFTARRFRI